MSHTIDKKTIISYDKKYIWHHLTQHKTLETKDPFVIISGSGMNVTDINGRQYLDATAGGVWTVNAGYARQQIVDAISEQLLKLPFYSGAAGTESGALLAKTLIDILPGLDRVYYSTSGSEANEKGYKLARQLAYFYNNGKKHKIIFRDRDYHGTTIGALSSCGQYERKNQYGPFVDGFIEMPHCCCYRCPFNKKYDECNIECATVLEDIILKEGADNVGLVVLESITAGGGVIAPVPEYFPIIEKICKKYDVLLHIDEVVCGLGRTGKWFGYQHYQVTPDIVTMAKGLASGYAAIAVTATTNKLFELFKADVSDKEHYFRDISTFGGCTAGPAAALANIKIIRDEKLLENVNTVGNYLFDCLLNLKDKYEMIGDVRGKGFLLGFELVQDRQTKKPMDEQTVMQITNHCMTNSGVLVGRTNRSLVGYNNVVLLSPAYICSKNDADIIIKALDSALAECL